MAVIAFGAGVLTWVKRRPAPVAGIAPWKTQGICDPAANDDER
jgi:hypothetical protein